MYGDTHRIILQYLMTAGQDSYDKVRKLYQKIENNMESTVQEFDQIISDINEAIKPFGQEIRKVVCEISALNILVFVNTISNELTLIHTDFKPKDFEYIKLVIGHILESDNRLATFGDLSNLPYKLTGSAYTKDRATHVLEELLQRGYLVELDDDNLAFGSRFIVEMEPYLKQQYRAGELTECEICKRNVFTGAKCIYCEKLFHKHCFRKYVERINKCPACQQKFVEGDNEENFSSPKLKKNRV